MPADRALVMTLALCCPWSGAHAADAGRAEVLKFCERFAQATPDKLVASRQARYVPGSAEVTRANFVDLLLMYLVNLFHPEDSEFVGGWYCTFSITTPQLCAGEVDLPIAEYAAFARYTAWPKLDIVSDNEIRDSDGELVGYAVAKYYELSCAPEP